LKSDAADLYPNKPGRGIQLLLIAGAGHRESAYSGSMGIDNCV